MWFQKKSKDYPKIALAMIVKGEDREAELLDRCLGGIKDASQLKSHQRKIDLSNTDGIAKHVDGIFITITGGKHPEKVKEVAEKYGAIISEREWDHNFANARNFNFSQVPKEYEFIAWTDTDDIWRNPHLIKKAMSIGQQSAADAVTLYYLYDFDESGQITVKHLKTRVVKNDGCLEWAGHIHEDFKENRNVTPFYNTEMEVIHLTDSERVETAMTRNSDVARRALLQDANDPRHYYNLGNAYLMEQKFNEAIEIYLTFLGMSNSEEERYLIWHRLSECYRSTGDLARALQAELEALAIRPWYPDPYHSLGETYYAMDKLGHAKEMIEIGLTKDIPEDKMIVWNPRDYDYNPRLLLAKIYVGMYQPREALKQLDKCLEVYPKSENIINLKKILAPEIKKFDYADKLYSKALRTRSKKKIKKLIDSIPDDFKYYPPIVRLRHEHFPKTETTGKDVSIFCGYTVNEWNPNVFREKGVGGSEEAIVQLVKRWADAGYNVNVYANVGHKEDTEHGVRWIPYIDWNPKDRFDVTIVWRNPKAIDFDINSEKILVDVHDVITPQEFTEERLSKIDKIMFKSKVQRDYYSNIPDDKVAIIPHGLDVKQFEERRKTVIKNPYKIINTSSPDRSLLTCMKIIEKVYYKLPDYLKPKLKFRWNYGFRVWDAEWASDDQMMNWRDKAMAQLERLKEKGIIEKESGDMISQDEVVNQYLESGLMLYPSEFFEIGFISGIKGALAGAIPITTDVFAQGEFLHDSFIFPSKVTYEDWPVDIAKGVDYGVKDKKVIDKIVDKIVEYFKDPSKFEEMREKIINRIRSEFDWGKAAEEWTKLF
jgi:tetratricopeptide (TPR) repeat protein